MYETLSASDNLASFTTDAVNGHLNYAQVLTSGAMTTPSSGSLVACSASHPCITTHVGSWIQYTAANTFGGTATTNGISFAIDPDGANGASEPVQMYLYANERITTVGSGATAPTSSGAYAGTTVTTDPAYVNDWA
jgi:hypothetical protein